MLRALGSFFRHRRRAVARWFANFRLPRLLTLDFYLQLIAWPFRYIIEAWKEGRVRDLIMGLPALIVFIVVGYFLGSASFNQVANNYWAWARTSLDNGEFAKAELQLERIIREGQGHVGTARFSLAMMYDELGDKERASALFALLAPDDTKGYPPAHRRLALLLSEEISSASSVEDLERLHWHLVSGNIDDDPEVALAWGRYAYAIRDAESALKYFQIAVEDHPFVWKQLGDINAFLGNMDAAKTSYEEANDYLSDRLLDRPKDHLSRVDYANSLMKLGRLDDAKVILEEGIRVSPDEVETWNGLLSALYVNYHDVLSLQGDRTVAELLIPLGKALEYAADFGPALSRLMAYATADVNANAELRTILQHAVVHSERKGLAHLALGNLSWLEGDTEKATFHYERARSLDTNLALVMNNLAWIAANEEDPDLDRALALAEEAVSASPDDLRFLDTRGTILFLKEDWSAALNDLEKAIKGVKDKRPVHHKLAVIYDRMKMTEIADEHRRLANE